GSPPYISPEQARGRANMDARTDIYSLGSVAYFLLTGQPPFVRDTAMELMVAHVHEPPTPLRDLRPGIPRDLEDIVLRCLAKDPADRVLDAESLSRALADCAAAHHWDHEQAAIWWRERSGSEVGRETVLAG